jgi:hypothetical protein
MFDAALVRRPATTRPRPAPQPADGSHAGGAYSPVVLFGDDDDQCRMDASISGGDETLDAVSPRRPRSAPFVPSFRPRTGPAPRRYVVGLSPCAQRRGARQLAPRRRPETQGRRNAVTTGAASSRPGRTWPDQPGNSRALVHLPQDRRAPRQQRPCQARPAKPRGGSRLRAQAPSWAQMSHSSWLGYDVDVGASSRLPKNSPDGAWSVAGR